MIFRRIGKTIIFTVIILLLGSLNFCSKKTIIPKPLEVIEILDFSKTTFDVSLNDLYSLPNSFSCDKDGKMYILDTQNHRVIKFDLKGNLLCQIGKIGQGESDLYRPVGITVSENELYILNQYGSELKRFTTEGGFIFGFKLEEGVKVSKSFIVIKNTIYVNQFKKENEEGILLAAYSKDGRLLKTLGKGYKISNFFANQVFNDAYLSHFNDFIYGCFRASPAFFKINITQNSETFKKLKFKEFVEIEQLAKQNGKQPPEFYYGKEKASIKKISFSIYFNCLVVDENKDIWACSNIDQGKIGVIYRLDSEGNLKEQYALRFRNNTARILKIFIYNTEYFSIIEQGRIAYLVKLKIDSKKG